MATLYLIEAHARREYACAGCYGAIARGELYFRHDPHPRARMHRAEKIKHICVECMPVPPGSSFERDPYTKRIRWPAEYVLVPEESKSDSPSRLRITTVGIGSLLAAKLATDESFVFRLTPGEFEEFVCDRLAAMGLESRRVGSVYQKDGGIDIVFWPRFTSFPFLGAAQVKHHRDPARKEGPSTVRDFAGTLAGQPFAAGVIVTNTSFTPDAEWFARERSGLIRLRDCRDVRRWIGGNFAKEHEWRDVPETLELCPGVHISLR